MREPSGAEAEAEAAARADGGRAAGLRAYGRLLRLSLAASAAADAAAGVVVGAGDWPGGPRPFLLMAASLAVYHGGMALNDWADRDEDARARPERPIPSGAVPAGAALAIAALLLALGPLLALAVDRGAALGLAVVALLAATYDVAGRGPWRGPLLLALCRAGNLATGIWAGRVLAPLDPGPTSLVTVVPLLFLPALYGGYVLFVSRLGRYEDAPDATPLGQRPARLLACASAMLLALPLAPLPVVPAPAAEPAWAAFLREHAVTLAMLVAAAGAFGLLRLVFRRTPWTPRRVLPAMGMALRRLLVFTSAAALLRGTPSGAAVSLAILAGYPLSYALRRVFPPS